LLVNHGLEPVQQWWKQRALSKLAVAVWMKELLANTQPILIALQQKIAALTLQLQSAAVPDQPRGLGKMTSVVIDRRLVIGIGSAIVARSPATPAYVLASALAVIPACSAV
jgi:hypothetical protein